MNKIKKLIPITLTTLAVTKIREHLEAKPQYNAIRIGVNSKGCNGFSYEFEYAVEPNEYDEVFEQDNIKLYIDPKAAMFIFGTEIDYEDNLMQSGFSFKNPNSVSECGCGNSFSV